MNVIPQEIIGRYQLLHQLGSGGMGAVYKAQDLKLKREVALKIMHPSLSHNQEFRDRFLQEAQSGARLKHPGIVQVHDICEEDDYLFIVEDFIAGENLTARMKALRAENQTMAVKEAVELVRQVSLALGYAHEHGVLHRDIKPANILLEPVSGERLPYRPVLTDLGLAKLMVGGLETMTGISLGTPAYMAPEQALGQTV
jgi:serine/threonine protein kinase